MSVQRVMGTETEYGVFDADAEHYNPIELSFDVVDAAAADERRHIHWDYRREDPVNDARGMRMPRASAPADMLTDAPQTTVLNTIVRNGGRVYVDHAHPEYSSPETTNPFDAVTYARAGDEIMKRAAYTASTEHNKHIVLMRSNVDGKGASWGMHESYVMDRNVPFAVVAQLCATHFVTRQIYTGSGRVGLGENSERPGYQLSQRSDYFHMFQALQTTFDRPIINTRDESHAMRDQRRLHVIIGDANRMDVPRVLQLGTTSMLLWVLEMDVQHPELGIGEQLASFELTDAVHSLHVVSHDLTLLEPLLLRSGQQQTAWNIQVRLYSLVYEVAAAIYDVTSNGEPLWPDPETRSVMVMWRQALLDTGAIMHARTERERMNLHNEASRVEWLLKWQLVRKMCKRVDPEGVLGNDVYADARVRAIDLQWAQLDVMQPSLFDTLNDQGMLERVCSKSDIEHAMSSAPADTRAWVREEFLRRFADQIIAVSWTQITARDIQDYDQNVGRMMTLTMDNPRMFTQAEAGPIMAHATSAPDAIAALLEQQARD
ncbi:ligase [Bifidobacterium dolichotidis]|uniref:Ligase n=1 Tax=Bifidobacterium dolichotidis TaxID=2306976 RepID=A0A430FPK1_9BIFI|nr:depupylase/deamidase Dop [Bifidobacterium dolichotidis]RSX54748.1 ligase [Bifidobacterium dolichotidis]